MDWNRWMEPKADPLYWLSKPTVDASQLYRENLVAFAKKAQRVHEQMNDAGHTLTDKALDAYEREAGLR
jgi:hypothetical protein